METSFSPNQKPRLVALMRPWPLPKGITRDQFKDLVDHLYQLLAANGLDHPAIYQWETSMRLLTARFATASAFSFPTQSCRS